MGSGCLMFPPQLSTSPPDPRSTARGDNCLSGINREINELISGVCVCVGGGGLASRSSTYGDDTSRLLFHQLVSLEQ